MSIQNVNINSMLQGKKYIIDRYLSSGGFGNTYVATNLLFEEKVAIKEFYMRGITERNRDNISISVSNEDNIIQFAEQKNKFIKEARRLRKLKDEHIVTVHDLFEENGTAYYVMDYIDGESVSSRLKRTGMPLSEQEALGILQQILEALEVIHQNGMFHLDIKPANIMIDSQGNAKLIDFGASKQTKTEGGATTSTGLSYTPGYAPIEQMAQNLSQFGPWTDIYSLGATLYYMLTLRHLPSPVDLLENESLLVMDNSISHQTQQLICRMMTPVRTQRPQNVAEIRKIITRKKETELTVTIGPITQQQEATLNISTDKETEIYNSLPQENREEENGEKKLENTKQEFLYEEDDEESIWERRVKNIAITMIVMFIIILSASMLNEDNENKEEDFPEIIDNSTSNPNSLPFFDTNDKNTQSTPSSDTKPKEQPIKRIVKPSRTTTPTRKYTTPTTPANVNSSSMPNVRNHTQTPPQKPVQNNNTNQRSPMDNISF